MLFGKFLVWQAGMMPSDLPATSLLSAPAPWVDGLLAVFSPPFSRLFVGSWVGVVAALSGVVLQLGLLLCLRTLMDRRSLVVRL